VSTAAVMRAPRVNISGARWVTVPGERGAAQHAARGARCHTPIWRDKDVAIKAAATPRRSAHASTPNRQGGAPTRRTSPAPLTHAAAVDKGACTTQNLGQPKVSELVGRRGGNQQRSSAYSVRSTWWQGRRAAENAGLHTLAGAPAALCQGVLPASLLPPCPCTPAAALAWPSPPLQARRRPCVPAAALARPPPPLRARPALIQR
jgi:hypothetical protein